MTPVNARPIRIVVERSGPRLEYVLGIIFDDLLKVGYSCVVGGESMATEGDLYYLPDPPSNKPSVHCSGMLSPQGAIAQTSFPYDFTELPDPAETDIFAWAFSRLVQVDRYQDQSSHHQDQSNHYQNQSPQAQNQGSQPVLIEDLAADLAHRLNIPLPEKTFDYEITIDVDNPWKHRHKPFHIRWGGLLKDLLKGNRTGTRERWRAITRKEDPFDTDGLIKDWCPPKKTTLFYLVDGDHPNDSRYNLRMGPYQKRVLEMKKAGYEIGLHPSYDSQLNAHTIQAQKDLLESVAGPIDRSRQHYLRYTLPETFQHLQKAGIQYEYSICPKDQTGPLTAIARPYPWYDLSQEKKTDLMLVPAVVMDRSLQQYLNLPPAQALEKIRKEIEQVRRVGGKFVIILHNETFSESGEWKGWREVIRKMLEDLKADGS